MKRFLLAVACLLPALAPHRATAQATILAGIDDFSKGSLLPIAANGNVGGYIFIYKLHDKDTVQHLRIFDENLQQVGESSVSTGKKAVVNQVLYESGHLLLTQYEPVDRYGHYTETVKVLDLDSSATATYQYLAPEPSAQGYSYLAVYPIGEYTSVPTTGFTGTYRTDPSKGGATIVMTDPGGKLLWKKPLALPGFGYCYVDLVGTTRNALLYFITGKRRQESRDGKSFLVALHPQTGEMLFKKPLEVGSEAWQPLFVKPVSDDTALICNQLSNASDALADARQTGFNYGLLNLKTGDISELRTVHYATDLNQDVEMVNPTKSKEGFIHLQNVLVFPDKSAVVVGEFFRRTVNGAALAAGIAGAMFGVVPTNMAQGTTGDLFLLRLSPEGNVTDMRQLDMRPERLSIPTGTSIASLGRYLDNAGAFNYHHTDDWDPEHKTVVVVGRDAQSEKGYSTKVIHITPTGQKVKTLLSAAQMREEPTRISKAKPGHVLLLKRDPKSKGVSLELMRTD